MDARIVVVVGLKSADPTPAGLATLGFGAYRLAASTLDAARTRPGLAAAGIFDAVTNEPLALAACPGSVDPAALVPAPDTTFGKRYAALAALGVR